MGMKTESGRFRSQALQAFVLSLLLTCTAGAGPYDAGFTQPALKGLPFLGPRVKVQQDGKIIIHGEGFDAIGGVETGPVARFHPDGTRDGTFAFSRDYASAFSVAPLSNGQMIINARLESFNGS